MASEERLSGSYGEMEELNERLECVTSIPNLTVKGRLNVLLFQGPSVYDAWFSATSNQVWRTELLRNWHKLRYVWG